MKNNAVLEVYKLDMELAARVAQRFVLQEIFLVDARISRNPLTVPPETFSLKHKCSREVLPPSDANKFLVRFRVAAFDGKEPNKLIMSIEASFCTSFVEKSQPDLWLDNDDDDGTETLLAYVEYVMTVNPISNAWPYWREFVQNMSSRMGFPALTVPLLEIVPKKAAAKKAKSQPIKKESTRRKKVNA